MALWKSGFVPFKVDCKVNWDIDNISPLTSLTEFVQLSNNRKPSTLFTVHFKSSSLSSTPKPTNRHKPLSIEFTIF